jgi:hypothetical protein
MAEELSVDLLVSRAVGMAFENFTQEHPNLAEALQQIDIDLDVVPRLRETEGYKNALEAYVQARIEIDFLNSLVALVQELIPMLRGIL